MTTGFNLPAQPTINQPPIVDHTGTSMNYQGWLNNGVTMRDYLANTSETIDTTFLRDFFVVSHSGTSVTVTPILPKPYIDRVGSTSKPYRLLSGQEVQLSENDLRVKGISKRYSLSTIWQWGTYYCTNPIYDGDGNIDLSKSTLYELIFIDDSNPLYWVLNLRQKTDSRYNGANYDLP
jgi:2-hydroxy-3-keto-5-methylthiopentenyl-1-phosphate phosphatase